MPNGEDKNLRRLLMACAVYRQRFGEWPTQARLHPVVLWDLSQVLSMDDFQRLANHLTLRTRDTMGISVGGKGVQDYAAVDHERLDAETLELAERWLDVHPSHRGS